MISDALASSAPPAYIEPVNSIPPHIDTDPSPAVEGPCYSPSRELLAAPQTVQPGVQFGRPTRSWNLHLWNCWGSAMTIHARFGVQGFAVLMFGLLHLLCLRWGRASLMAAYLLLLLAAPYYAGRLRIQHPFARFVRRLFFDLFTYPGDPCPPRIQVRAFPLMFISLSSVLLLFWP